VTIDKTDKVPETDTY